MSEPISPQAVVDRLGWRYATKKFDSSKKIPAQVWEALEQSLILAPSSFGLQPWKFFVVTNPELRAKLRVSSWNQSQVTDASHLVVLARKIIINSADVERLANRIAKVREVPLTAINDYKNMMLGYVNNPPPGFDMASWNAKQVYIASGFFMSAAAMMGVDVCPMEGFSATEYDKVLNLTEQGYSSSLVLAAGYRAADDASSSAKKVRFEKSEVLAYI